MPCSDGSSGCNCSPQVIYKTQYVNNPEDNRTMLSLIKRNEYLEACLCAVFCELDKVGITEEIIKKSEENGKIQLSDIWQLHKQKDLNRLNQELSKFSEHEISMIKQILNKK